MQSGRLLPCPSCARHVRSHETACPFCAAALAPSPVGERLARPASSRLSRAALFALGASAAAVAACSSSSVGSNFPESDAGEDVTQSQAIYGGPPADGGEDARVLVDAAYGGPPADAADAGDAADDADSGAAPAYGAPP